MTAKVLDVKTALLTGILYWYTDMLSQRKQDLLGDQSISRHLGEPTQERSNDYTTSHAGGSKHIHPRLFCVFQLNLDGRLDLSHFSLHQDRVSITFAMIFDQKLKSLIVSVFTHKPSRTLWDETVDVW